ncbi:MAG: FeoA family protein [Halanaerobiaceae bacterium]
MLLSELPLKTRGIINKITLEGPEKRRLLDLGLIPGTEIEFIRQSPCGDPRAYLFRDTIIAFRREETDKILIREEFK